MERSRRGNTQKIREEYKFKKRRMKEKKNKNI